MTRPSREERNSRAIRANGFLSEAARNTKASATATVECPVPFPWRKMNKKIPFNALPNKVKVYIKFRPFTGCIQTDGTVSACAISSVKMLCHYHHLLQVDKKMLYDQVHSPLGVAIKTMDHEYHLGETISSGTSGVFRLRLRNIKNSCFRIWFTVQNKSTIDTQSTLDRYQYLATPSRFYLQDGGTTITPIIESTSANNQAIFHYNTEMFPEGEHFNIFSIPLCENSKIMASEDDCYGSRFLSNYNNPELCIEFDSATGADYYLNVWGDVHQTILYHNGDFRKYLLV